MTPNLGEAISLQGKPDNFGYNQVSKGFGQMAAAKARKDAAIAKAAEDDAAKWSSYSNAVKISPDINPIFHNYVKDETGKFIYKLGEAHNQNPNQDPRNLSSVIDSKAGLDLTLSNVSNQSKAYAQFDNAIGEVLKHPEDYDIDHAAMDEYVKSMQQRSPTDGWKKIVGSDQGFINPDETLRKIVKYKYDWQNDFLKSNVKPVIIERGYQSPNGEYIATSDGKSVDVAASKNQLGAIVDNPSSKIGQHVLAQANGNRDAAVNMLFDSYGYKGVNSYKQGLKSKSQSVGIEEFNAGLKKDVVIAGGETPFVLDLKNGVKFDFNFPGSQTVLKGYTPLVPKSTTTTKVLPKETIDLRTGEPIPKDETGSSKAVTYKDVTMVPVDISTGKRVDDVDMGKVKEAGHLKYKAMVPAVYSDKVDKWDGTGQRPQEDEYLIPVDVFTPTKEQTDAINKQLNELNGSSKKAVSTNAKASIVEVKRKTKDGKIAIFNGNTKEFIRYE